jgi:hypothetical protein
MNADLAMALWASLTDDQRDAAIPLRPDQRDAIVAVVRISNYRIFVPWESVRKTRGTNPDAGGVARAERRRHAARRWQRASAARFAFADVEDAIRANRVEPARLSVRSRRLAPHRPRRFRTPSTSGSITIAS